MSSSTLHVPNAPPTTISKATATLIAALIPHVPATPATVAILRIPPYDALPLFFALRDLDAIPVWLNNRFSTSSILQALASVPCALLLLPYPLDSDLHHLLSLLDSLPNPPTPLSLISSPSTSFVTPQYAIPSGPVISAPPPPADCAAVFFTSGTTRASKPVALTWESLTIQSQAKISLLSLSSTTIYFHLAPLFHLGGFSSALATALISATHVFPPPHLHPTNPSHATRLLHLIRTSGTTLLVLVPTVLQLLVDAADAAELIIPSVSTLLYGGSFASSNLIRSARVAFPTAQIFGAYGMTETASSITFLNHPPHADVPHQCVGTPLPHVRVEVRERLPHGLGPSVADTIGEVVTKGPHIMSGYIGLSRTTLDAFTSDSWLRTGDIGYMKGGRLFLVGRLHDVIKSGGEKIFAGEVEMTLTAHPLVREAAVVGIPHRILGEAVAAAVVLANNCPSAENVLKGVRDFCRDCLAAYKCPKWILAQKGLPKNANGKVVKEKLRQILQVTFQPRLAKL